MTPEELDAIIAQHKYPTLHAGQTGINVITLQIWLRMLGFYSGSINGRLDESTAQAVESFRIEQRAQGTPVTTPSAAVLDRDTWVLMDDLLWQRRPPDPMTLDRPPFPRRSSYDSEAKYEKALYEGLLTFGFPVQSAQTSLRLPFVINERGVAILHGVPPGSYELELGEPPPPDQGSAELRIRDTGDHPLSGLVRLTSGDVERKVPIAAGHALVTGLAPGEYQLAIERIDDSNQTITNTGSLEIRLFDENEAPVGATATLIGRTADASSLQRAVMLFQALARKIAHGLEPNNNSGPTHLLSGTLAETADHTNERIWRDFELTWGRFYGAPWMGILFHPEENVGDTGQAAETLNWGEHKTIAMLYEWGLAYLRSSESVADLEQRLQRPIAVRYISRPLGGKVRNRSDFAQIGTDAALHLPRLSPAIIDGLATGPLYGGIDYDSPEYSSFHLRTQLTAFASLYSTHTALCPDTPLVRAMPATFEALITNDLSRKRTLANTHLTRQWWTEQGPSPPLHSGRYSSAHIEDLAMSLIKVYVPAGDRTAAANAWIDTLPDNEKALARNLLRGFNNYWSMLNGPIDMKELYEIYNLRMSVSGEISQLQSPTGRRRFLPHTYNIEGEVFPFHHTTIRILGGTVPRAPERALLISENIVTAQHYRGRDQNWKVDISESHYSQEPPVWFGPVFPFQVLSAEVFTKTPDLDTLRYQGCRIRIRIIADGQTLPDGEALQTWELLLAHFTALHIDIFREGQTSKPLENRIIFRPGTFLGMTMRLIGQQDGPHLHIDSEMNGIRTFKRDKIFKLWTGRQTKKIP